MRPTGIGAGVSDDYNKVSGLDTGRVERSILSIRQAKVECTDCFASVSSECNRKTVYRTNNQCFEKNHKRKAFVIAPYVPIFAVSIPEGFSDRIPTKRPTAFPKDFLTGVP